MSRSPSGSNAHIFRAYECKADEISDLIDELDMMMKQDRLLQEEITGYRVKKSLEKLQETKKKLSIYLETLKGERAVNDDKHKLVMPKQQEFF